MNLRHAPDDEIEEISELLTAHDIDFYVTRPGAWGISAPGIWLQKTQQYDQARALLDSYQQQRLNAQREQYDALRRAGKQRTFLHNLMEYPVAVILYCLLIAFILYVSINPFLLRNP